MNIFIAYDYAHHPLAVLVATSKQFAKVAFDALPNCDFNSIEEFDPSDIDLEGDVFFLLTSKETDNRPGVRVWKRGK